METSKKPKAKVAFPDKLRPLFEPHRYKVAYGGRGGAKSWGFARALLTLGTKKDKPLRILCVRELQKSIRDSVHRLLSDQIVALSLQGFYKITHHSIVGLNGTEFFFEGLRHNTMQIKSYEGVDIVWVEEAVTVSKTSWDVLIPTIRREGSEIWISFNAELEDDETYQRFVVHPPTDAVVMNINWRDNPWFPEVLRIEKDDLAIKDPDAHLNVWEGHCKETLDGAIYAEEIRDAKRDGRIARVPHVPNSVVNCFWDLGWSDLTSIWFIQKVALEYRVINYYQNSQKPLSHYLNIQQEYANKYRYIYGKDYLPHDAQAHQLGLGKSIEEMMLDLGKKLEIVPRLSVADGIHAARTVFPSCWFDAEKCADGLQALRRYRYDVHPDTGRISKQPLHDENSNGADAWRYFAVTPHIMVEAYTGKGAGTFEAEYDPFEEGRT